MKTTLRITLACWICWQFVCCTGVPITFNAGLSGQTKDGTNYHVNASIPMGARTSAKEVYDVKP
jgi:hypothetical protein